MRNIIILSVFLLILFITMFLASCDDFFSSTIEIFNDQQTNVPSTIELKKQEEQEEQEFNQPQN